jgi:hypothetical protein
VRRRLTIVVLVVLVLALVAAAALVGLRWWREGHRSDLQEAASYAPADAERLSWTDWADVRAKVGADLDASSSDAQLRRFLDDGFDADLTSASALVQSAPVLQDRFGFSPATAEWELFSQSEQGAVVIVRMPDGTDFDDLADRLEHTGFARPASEDGVWGGDEELLAGLGSLTPELQYVALDADDHLVLTSDTEDYLERAVEGLGGDELPEGMSEVTEAAGDALTASVYDGAYTCSALAMSHADTSDQAEADELVRRAGEVNPVTAFAMAVQPGGHVRAVMSFEAEDQARANATTRAALAGGPAPGQGGDFADRFTVDSAKAVGSVVTLDLVPREGTYVFSDLTSGPVLFATC